MIRRPASLSATPAANLLSAVTAGVAAAVAVVLFGLPLPAHAAAPSAVQSWSVEPGTIAALVEDHRAPLVSVRIGFAAGADSPWVRKSHADEALEMQFIDPDRRLQRRADELSADVSLSVSGKRSYLQLSCLKPDLDACLALAREILANRAFDRREIKRRAGEASMNWKSSLKEPGFVKEQAIARLLFEADDPRRRYYEKPKRPSTESAKLLAARDTLIRLPGRVIGFAGDVTRAEAETLAKTLLPADLATAPPDLAARYAPLTPAERRPRAQDVALPRLTQIYFGCVRESLRLTDDDYPALAIADHVLGRHFYSRLQVALRHESGDTYDASTSNGAGMEPGRYELTTFTRLDKEQDTETRLREVLAKIHADGITDDERQAAIGFYRGRRVFARQSPDSTLWWWLKEWDNGLPQGFYDALPERMAGVTLAHINEVIRQFYDPALFTMVKVRPAR